MNVKGKQIDLGTSLIALLIAAIALAAIWQTREYSAFGSIFPIVVSAVMLLGSLGVFVRCVTGKAPAKEAEARSAAGMRRSFALIAIMILWALTLERVGFAISSWFSFVAIAFVADNERPTPRRIAIYAVVALVVVGGLYFLFQNLLNVRLP